MAGADRDAHAASIEAFSHRLDHLSSRGRQLRTAVADQPESPAALQALGVWQRDCAATISQLSGGSKDHWLARAFSSALLVPAAGHTADVATIVERILDVLQSARRSVVEAVAPAPRDVEQPLPAPRRFPTIENAALRASLEQAYLDGHAALGRGACEHALLTFCSIIETIITDALDRHGAGRLHPFGAPGAPLMTWPFATRIAVAERAGIISRACARLPDVARDYRDRIERAGAPGDSREVSPRDVRQTSAVLNVILRDLSPGR